MFSGFDREGALAGHACLGLTVTLASVGVCTEFEVVRSDFGEDLSSFEVLLEVASHA